VEPLEETIDLMKETIKSHHIERLQSGTCGIQGGISLVDLITSYERISSHCANVALHIVKKVSNIQGFDDMHGRITDRKSRDTEEYKALLHYYHALYIDTIEHPQPDEAAQSSQQTAGNVSALPEPSGSATGKKHADAADKHIHTGTANKHSSDADKSGKSHASKKKDEESKKKNAGSESKKKHK
jgi:phosphate:Na+ symporter